LNEINTSLNGGESVYLLLRVQGTWLGDVFGLPPGMSLISLPDNSYYLTNAPSSALGSSSSSQLNINGDNNVSIENNLTATALSGQNGIIGASNSTINTGSALASANIANIANTNIVGRNWILAIINIFGNFKGNISFGQPDLWIGEQIEAPSSWIENDSVVTYKYTITNKGDAPATEVKLDDFYDTAHIDALSSSLPYTTSKDHLSWDIGTLAPGATTEITYQAKIKNAPPSTDITNTATLSLHETDGNPADNTDTATIRTTPASGNGPYTGGGNGNSDSNNTTASNSNQTSNDPNGTGGSSGAQNPINKITVTRTTSSAAVSTDNPKTTESLVVANPTDGTISSVVLHDVLYDSAKNTLNDEPWQIGDILPHEEVDISYDITFKPDASPGTYTLSTFLAGPNKEAASYEQNGTITLVGTGTGENITQAAGGGINSGSKTKPKSKSASIALENTQKGNNNLNILNVLAPKVAEAKDLDLTASAVNSGMTVSDDLFLVLVSMLILSFLYKENEIYIKKRERKIMSQ
jgi:hypothetical protein